MSMEDTLTSISLKKWNEGDQQGLDLLVKRHLPWIRNHVRKRMGAQLRNLAETNDYVQDAMVEFLRYGPRIQLADENHFRALLVRIIENALRDRYKWFTALRRKHARQRPLPGDTVLALDLPKDAVRTPSQDAQRNEGEAWIRLGMELLDPSDRELLVMRQWESLPFEQIAKQLDISEKAASMRYSRTLAKLGRKIGAMRKGRLDKVLDGLKGHP